MTKRSAASTVILALVLLCAACTQEAPPSLESLMDTYFAAEGTSSRNQAIQGIIYSGASAEDVAAQLRAGREYAADVVRGWSVYSVESMDGFTRPFHVYVPESYEPTRPHPAIVFLHGLVSVEHSIEDLIPLRAVWEDIASSEGMIVLLPHADPQAPWWSAVGLANVNAALGNTKRLVNVDENRVFVTGFSDGGSGAYWLALQDPTPWAGFIATYGDPNIGAVGSFHAYPRNLLNRPLRMVNGEADPQYPAAEIGLYVDQLAALGVDIEWAAYPTAHDFSFFADEKAQSLAFMTDTVRDPLPDHVVWETSNPAVGRCDWVQIDAIGDVGNNAELEDVNLLYLSAQQLLGVGIEDYTVDGALVANVFPGFVAHSAGVQAGDLLLSVEDQMIASSDDIRLAMTNRQPGDVIHITVIREGETLKLSAAVPEPFPIYPRLMIAGAIDVVADGNRIEVSARNVTNYTLYLSSQQFDLGQPIEVITNGQISFHDTVSPNIRFMLEQAAIDLDRQAVYEAKLEIIVNPAGLRD